ncbi:hypothetical protein BH10BAC2_BH10BAC2_18080 [soil metagenome]
MEGFIIRNSSTVWDSDVHAGTVVLNSAYIPRLAVQRLQSKACIFEIQQIDTDNIKLYYVRASTVNTITVTLYGKDACVLIHAVLSGRITHRTKQAGERTLHTGQYCMFYAPGDDIYISVEGAQQAVVLDILLPAYAVLAQLAIYPSHVLFTEKIKHKEACYLSEEVLYLHAGIYDLISRLLVAPYSKKLHPLYETLCSALLREMLASSLHHERQNNLVQEAWMQSIYTIKAFIDQRIDLHFTIDQLAKKAGINKRQLKAGFKALFGSGVYRYLKMERMKAAYAALEQTTASIKYISGKCGYRNVHSFSRAFTLYFGKSPGAVRKK